VSAVRAQSTPQADARLVSPPGDAAGPVTSPVESCRVRHSVASRSRGRFSAVMTVTNTGRSPVRGWTLRWGYPDLEPPAAPRLSDGWRAAVSVDAFGGQAIDVEASHLIPPGGSVTIAYLGTTSGQTPVPDRFTLNGVRCR